MEEDGGDPWPSIDITVPLHDPDSALIEVVAVVRPSKSYIEEGRRRGSNREIRQRGLGLRYG